MKLSNLVCPEAILTQPAENERDAVIKELVNALGKAGAITKKNIEAIAQAVIDRENEASTGIGKGVAVPHVKSNVVKKPVAAIALCSEGLDFSSLDKQPVYSVVLLISPTADSDSHIASMEIIFKNLQKEDFRSFLRQAKSAEDVLSLLKEADSNEL